MAIRTTRWECEGGLDVVSPRGRRYRSAGAAQVLVNYLSREDGYRRLEGWERFDGRPAPSSSVDPAEQVRLRADVGDVPGDGPILGMFLFRGAVYALRAVEPEDGAAASPTALWRAGPTGWDEVHLGVAVRLSGVSVGLPPVGSWIGVDSLWYGEVVDAWRLSGTFEAGDARVGVVLRDLVPGSVRIADGQDVRTRLDVSYWKATFVLPGDGPGRVYPALSDQDETVLVARRLTPRDLPARDFTFDGLAAPPSGIGIDMDHRSVAWVLGGGRARPLRLPRTASYGTLDGVQRIPGPDAGALRRIAPTGDGFALDPACTRPVGLFGGPDTGGARWVLCAASRRVYAHATDPAGTRLPARDVDLSALPDVFPDTPDAGVVGVTTTGWGLEVDGTRRTRRAWVALRDGRFEPFSLPAAGAPVHQGLESQRIPLASDEDRVDAVFSNGSGSLLWAVVGGEAQAWSVDQARVRPGRGIPLDTLVGRAEAAVSDGRTVWVLDAHEEDTAGVCRAYGSSFLGNQYENDWAIPASGAGGIERPSNLVHVPEVQAVNLVPGTPAVRYAYAGAGLLRAFTRQGRTVAAPGGPFATGWTADPARNAALEPGIGQVAGMALSADGRRLLVLALAPGAARWRCRVYDLPLGAAPRETARSFDVDPALFGPADPAPRGMAVTAAGIVVLWMGRAGNARLLVWQEDGTYRADRGVDLGSRDVPAQGGITSWDGVVWIAQPTARRLNSRVMDGGARHGQSTTGSRRYRLPGERTDEPAADSLMPLAILVTPQPYSLGGRRVTRLTAEVCQAAGPVIRVLNAGVDFAAAQEHLRRAAYWPFPGAFGWDPVAQVVVAEYRPQQTLRRDATERTMLDLLGDRALMLSGPSGSVSLPFESASVSADRATSTGRRAVRYRWGAPGAAAQAALSGQEPGETITAEIRTLLEGPVPDPEAFGGGRVDGAAERYRMASITPRARVRTIEANFYGQDRQSAIYGVTGETRAFVFDGARLRLIDTGAEARGVFPAFVAEHAGHLFLGYRNGAILWGGLDPPLAFTAAAGAGELATGDEVTGLVGGYREALFIAGRHSMRVLKGTSARDFVMRELSREMGAVEHTLTVGQRLVCLDDRGMRAADQVEAHGDFAVSTLSQSVDPLIQRYRSRGMPVTAAFAWGSRSAWVVCFEGGDALCATWVTRIGRNGSYEAIEFSTLQLPATVRTAAVGEARDGTERVFFSMDGAEHAGRVYELGKGWSADGAPLEAVCAFGFNDFGAPDRMKAYRQVSVESRADLASKVALAVVFDDGRSGGALPAAGGVSLVSTTSSWDLVYWDAFQWDRGETPVARKHVRALGRNLSVLVASDPESVVPPHVLSAVFVGWIPRRIDRRI